MTIAIPEPRTSAGEPIRQRELARPRIVLVGNPNTGKTTLFNRLCGLRAKTANFPGTTTDRARSGKIRAGGGRGVEVVDLPGLYASDSTCRNRRVAATGARAAPAESRKPDAAIVVVDATQPRRATSVWSASCSPAACPFVVALNMIDLAQRRGLSFDLGAARRATRRAGRADRRRAAARASTSCSRPSSGELRGADPQRREGAAGERLRRPRRPGPRRIVGESVGGARARRQRRRHAARAARRGLHPSGPRPRRSSTP